MSERKVPVAKQELSLHKILEDRHELQLAGHRVGEQRGRKKERFCEQAPENVKD